MIANPNQNLPLRAVELFTGAETRQQELANACKWLAAIHYLRTQSRNGWKFDQQSQRTLPL
jgi:hypothetical protein